MEIILNKIFFIIFKQQTCNFYKKNPVSYFYTWYSTQFVRSFGNRDYFIVGIEVEFIIRGSNIRYRVVRFKICKIQFVFTVT